MLLLLKLIQKRLYQQIELNTQTTPSSVDITRERTRDRYTQRTVSVFAHLGGISDEWVGLERLIKVERIGTRAGRPYHQLVYYISSLSLSAAEFARGIRAHWGIENRLHWVKDVVLAEDSQKIRQGNAPANLSLLRSLVINILRHQGYASITSAQRLIGHNLEQIFLLLQ